MSRPLLAILSAACLVLSAAADAPGTPNPAELVRRLGDESFEVREKALAALRELGLAAEPALQRGLQSDDAEVRSACASLLARARRDDREARLKALLDDRDGKSDHALPGWPRFAEVAGRDLPARKFFTLVQRSDAPLLELAEKDPKEAAARLSPRAGTLAVALITPKADDAAFTDAVTLLFVASDARVPADAATFAALCRAMEVLANRKTLRGRWVESEPCNRLLLAFLRRRDDPASLDRALSVATAFELKDARDWAMTLATTRTLPGPTRGLALLLLGRVGDKELAPRLEALLSDTTAVGEKTLGTVRLTAEVRDVALAALIQLRGGRAEEYGFPYLQAVPGLKALPAPACLGFANAADREAALKRWKDGRGSD